MLMSACAESITRLIDEPKAEWAKHRARARKDLRRLLCSWFLSGRWHYLPLLLSDTGSMLAREKYSAFAIDRIYANQPAGRGWLGRRLDRYVLELPVHRAVRDRFEFVTLRMAKAIQSHLGDGGGQVNVLSVPCGLGRDLCNASGIIRRDNPDAIRRLRFIALDLDYEGRVLEEVRRRARAAGIQVQLVQANILDETSWTWLRDHGTPFSVVSCIGLAPWLSPDELKRLLQCFTNHLHIGGHILLDRFDRGRHSKLGEGAEILAHYHTDRAYREYLQMFGLTLQAREILGDGEGMIYLLQKTV